MSAYGKLVSGTSSWEATINSAQSPSSLATSTMLIEQASSPIMSSLCSAFTRFVSFSAVFNPEGVRYFLIGLRAEPPAFGDWSSSNSNSGPWPHRKRARRLSCPYVPTASMMKPVRFFGSGVPPVGRLSICALLSAREPLLSKTYFLAGISPSLST